MLLRVIVCVAGGDCEVSKMRRPWLTGGGCAVESSKNGHACY